MNEDWNIYWFKCLNQRKAATPYNRVTAFLHFPWEIYTRSVAADPNIFFLSMSWLEKKTRFRPKSYVSETRRIVRIGLLLSAQIRPANLHLISLAMPQSLLRCTDSTCSHCVCQIYAFGIRTTKKWRPTNLRRIILLPGGWDGRHHFHTVSLHPDGCFDGESSGDSEPERRTACCIYCWFCIQTAAISAKCTWFAGNYCINRILLAEILNFQGTKSILGMGSLSFL